MIDLLLSLCSDTTNVSFIMAMLWHRQWMVDSFEGDSRSFMGNGSSRLEVINFALTSYSVVAMVLVDVYMLWMSSLSSTRVYCRERAFAWLLVETRCYSMLLVVAIRYVTY